MIDMHKMLFMLERYEEKRKMKFITCLIMSTVLFGCSGSDEVVFHDDNDCVACTEQLMTHPLNLEHHSDNGKACSETKEKYNNLFECVCDPLNAEFNDCGSFCDNTEKNVSVEISQRCHDYVFNKKCKEFYFECALDGPK
jgi:hypothetical protein